MTGRGRARRFASNALLGIAIGLLSYYALTTLSEHAAQGSLRRDAQTPAAFASTRLPEQVETTTAAVLDFEGWETQDYEYWASLPEGGAFGRLVIETIGLDAIVVNGTATADLRRGPGFLLWTDLPGAAGTTGISGHRTTYGAPFRRLGELAPGATIDLYSPYRRYRYRVTGTLVVRPDETEVMASGDEAKLVLTACHPPYSARYRLVVQADLVEVRRIEDAE